MTSPNHPDQPRSTPHTYPLPPQFPGYGHPVSTQAPTPGPPAPKPKRTWVWLAVGGAALLVAAIVVAVLVDRSSPEAAAVRTLTAEHTLTYTVEGSGSVEVSYGSEAAADARERVTLPWSTQESVTGISWAMLTASGESTGPITCRITLEDGRVLAEERSRGDLGFAMCSGVTPYDG